MNRLALFFGITLSVSTSSQLILCNIHNKLMTHESTNESHNDTCRSLVIQTEADLYQMYNNIVYTLDMFKKNLIETQSLLQTISLDNKDAKSILSSVEKNIQSLRFLIWGGLVKEGLPSQLTLLKTHVIKIISNKSEQKNIHAKIKDLEDLVHLYSKNLDKLEKQAEDIAKKLNSDFCGKPYAWD